LAQVIYFYLPWFWSLWRQTRLCQEYIADAAAAQPPAAAEDYAEFLLNLTAKPALPVAAAGVLGNSSDLYRRVSMLLKSPIRVESSCPKSWSLAAGGGLLALAILAAGVGVRLEPTISAAEPKVQTVLPADEPDKAPPKSEPKKKTEPVEKPVPPAPLDAEHLRKEALDRAEKLRRQALQQAGEIRRSAPPWVWPNEGRLGVRIEPPSSILVDQLDLPKGAGQVVVQVLPNSAAAKAGLKKHDILLEVDGKAVPTDYFQFRRQLDAIKVKPVDIVLVRKGKKETIKGVTLPVRAEFWERSAVMPATGFYGAPVPVPPAVRPAQPGSVMTTITRTADRFTTRYQEGNLVITLTGSVADGKAKVGEIKVQDAGVGRKFSDAEKVPEQYRDKVKNLIETTEKGSIRIESKP
jgi:membrane-associated protease RseP (regulator of RpoE activity)